MFQKTMDTILQGIPNVICYIDDILVTGSDDDAHLRHLAEVLERLEKHGVKPGSQYAAEPRVASRHEFVNWQTRTLRDAP